MTNYSELYQASRTDWDMRQLVGKLCNGVDEAEAKLEKARIRLNFPEDWSPGYDRTVQSGAHALISWAQKANAINGVGDMNALIGELCGAIDIIEDRLKDLEPSKRGRPTNAERAARG